MPNFRSPMTSPLEMPGYSQLYSILGLPRFPEDVDYKSMTNEELLAVLKKSPDFEKFVFPNDWYSKYELPEKKCMDMKQFLKEAPWMRTAMNYYVGKEDKEAKPGGNRPILPAPEVPTVTLLQNSFSDNPALTNQTVSGCLEDSQQS